MDYAALDKYDSRTYANHGWVAVNRVLSGTGLKRLYSQFSQLKNNRHRFPTTPSGETLLVVGIIRRFQGTPAEIELKRLERMFTAAVEKTQTTEGEKKFSIQQDLMVITL